MKLSNTTLLSLAATAVAAPVATVTVHEHVRHTVIVEGYVYVDGTTTSTGYRTINEESFESAFSTSESFSTGESYSTSFFTQVVADGAAAAPSSQAVAAEHVSHEGTTTTTAPSTTSTAQQTTLTPTRTKKAATSASATSAPATKKAATSTPATTSAATSTPATTSAATSTSSSNSNLSSFASSMLDEHNAKRALHKDTPALSWSDELASYAQNYADGYDCSGSLTHSYGSYGENLAIGYGTTGAVDGWYDEIKDYSYSNPVYSPGTGHFTQVVWKSTTKVGCGIKQCGDVWGQYIICSYDPAGNMEGEFGSNVEPLA
ncbi:Pry3 [Kluyveromyces lactis]|nr:Pry3 [Kluyveromyces lactis]